MDRVRGNWGGCATMGGYAVTNYELCTTERLRPSMLVSLSLLGFGIGHPLRFIFFTHALLDWNFM